MNMKVIVMMSHNIQADGDWMIVLTHFYIVCIFYYFLLNVLVAFVFISLYVAAVCQLPSCDHCSHAYLLPFT